jgi:hypothetical protein
VLNPWLPANGHNAFTSTVFNGQTGINMKLRTAVKSLQLALGITIISIAFCAHSITANLTFPSINPALQASGGTSSGAAKKPKKEKKAKGKKGGGVTFYEGSGETRAERDKRLTRECRGRSNSGLCEGYTRP